MGKDVPRIGVIFGTHNKESVEVILDTLVENGLAERVDSDGGEGKGVLRIPDETGHRVTVGQLYGA